MFVYTIQPVVKTVVSCKRAITVTASLVGPFLLLLLWKNKWLSRR